MFTRIQQALNNPESKHFLVVNDLLVVTTSISIISIILSTVESLSYLSALFKAIELITVTIFTLEYIARISTADQKLRYIFSFFGLIDLLSIIPYYITGTNLTFLKSARIISLLRFLRILRVAKLSRFKTKQNEVAKMHQLQRLNVQIYCTILAAAIISFGSLIYIVEQPTPEFANAPLGMMWATKVLMGGVPSMHPATIIGELVMISARFCGLILLGLMIQIVGVSVNKFLLGSAK